MRHLGECDRMEYIVDLIRNSEETIFIMSMNASKIQELFENNKKKTDAIWSIDGHQCTTEKNIYREFGTKLSFPEYFGENWDAFIDCMEDLRYCGKNSNCNNHFFIIKNAIFLKKLNTEERRIFLEIMHEQEEHWNFGMNRKRGVYKFILCCQRDRRYEITDMLSACNIPYLDMEQFF
jgi:hypothetical protein